MRTGTPFVAVALAAAALATGSALGGQPPRRCGAIVVDPAQPRVGLPVQGTYEVAVFSSDDHVPPPRCRTALQWSRAYEANGAVPKGFKVKALRGRTGRAFLRVGNEDVGFRVLWTH